MERLTDEILFSEISKHGVATLDSLLQLVLGTSSRSKCN